MPGSLLSDGPIRADVLQISSRCLSLELSQLFSVDVVAHGFGILPDSTVDDVSSRAYVSILVTSRIT